MDVELSLLAIPAGQLFLQPDIEADKKIAAPHLPLSQGSVILILSLTSYCPGSILSFIGWYSNKANLVNQGVVLSYLIALQPK